jgi:hypothetical protein
MFQFWSITTRKSKPCIQSLMGSFFYDTSTFQWLWLSRMKEHEWKGVGIQLNMSGVGVEFNRAKKFGIMFYIIFKSNYGLSKIIMCLLLK